MTTTLTADLLISVDGCAGSENLPGYFGYLGPDLQEWFDTIAAEPHLALIGRTTYEVMSSIPDEAKDVSWERTTQNDTVVFSRSLTDVDWPNARVAGDLLTETTDLKQTSDVPLQTFGSLSLVRQLVGAGLVDRLRLVTFPLFAGPAGRDWAFSDFASAELELVDHRVLDGRLLLVEYTPTGKDIPRA